VVFPPEMNGDFIEKANALHISDQYLEFIKYLNGILKEAQKK
jgi:hypothetical protein